MTGKQNVSKTTGTLLDIEQLDQIVAAAGGPAVAERKKARH